MFRLIYFFIIYLLSANFVMSISIEEVKSSTEYYFGSGVAENEKEASDIALNELVKQIAIFVKTSFRNIINETNNDYTEPVTWAATGANHGRV